MCVRENGRKEGFGLSELHRLIMLEVIRGARGELM